MAALPKSRDIKTLLDDAHNALQTSFKLGIKLSLNRQLSFRYWTPSHVSTTPSNNSVPLIPMCICILHST